MNLLRGAVDADGASLSVDGAKVMLPTPVPGFAGRSVQFGVRPEQLRLSGSAFDMEVVMVESLGADHLVHGRIGQQTVIVRAGPDANPSIGSRIGVAFDAGAVHWFDATSGMRL